MTELRVTYLKQLTTLLLPNSMTNTQILNNSQTSHNPIITSEDHPLENSEDIQLPEFPPIDISFPQNIMDWN